MSSFELPKTPTKHEAFIPYIAGNPQESLLELVAPFNEYEGRLREGFAQFRDDSAVQAPLVNAVPVYQGHEDSIRIRARSTEDESVNSKYIMPLLNKDRKKTGEPAIAPSFKQFKKNFDLFSESSMVDLDWNNVVAAGSAVVTSLLPVPAKHAESKRALREYYHQQLAPSSDVDLFIWGLDENAAIEKIKQIETHIRDSILSETTTIRTKNAITIASQYPIRHVQIVLRLYKNISEILTGFDVDSSCFAYNGSQVYGTPRGIVAFMSQCNSIDLTRRSPSYESRLAKYAHRGFEVYCPFLERDLIDPTIFERSFARTMGLARLLVLERLPKMNDREAYMDQRRKERGRPPLNTRGRYRRGGVGGNMKDKDPEDIAEWDFEGDISNYHTFTVPYGPRITPKKIERLLFSKDLLLNAEWNVKKDRTVHLHRHPCFIGDAASVVSDCCQSCPKPTTEEEEEVAAEESKHYVSGKLEFMKDDPGRQAIGSFNPITTGDWLEMAYIGNVQELCQAIVDRDLSFVREWCQKEDVNLDSRDHTGRTPLQLACQSSSLEVVKCLIDSGARIVARLADGTTALHIATARGDVDIVQALLEKSEANEEVEEERKDKARAAKKAASNTQSASHPLPHDEDVAMDSSESDDDDDDDNDDNVDSDESDEDMDEDSEKYEMSASKDDTLTQGSFVKVKGDALDEDDLFEAEGQEPDIYDVNVLAWDSPVSPLHLAVLFGHVKVIEVLVDRFGADVLLPIKLLNQYSKTPRAAILTLVLAAQLPSPEDDTVAKKLLDRGASTAQADINQVSAVHYIVALGKVDLIKSLFSNDGPSISAALSHVAVTGSSEWNTNTSTPLLTAVSAKDEVLVRALLEIGVSPEVSFDTFARSYMSNFGSKWHKPSNDQVKGNFGRSFEQPVIKAITIEAPTIARVLLEKGAEVNTLTINGNNVLSNDRHSGTTVGTSLLDYLDQQIESLKNQLKPTTFKDPFVLEEDSHYLGQSQPGTYQYWQLHTQLSAAKEMIKQWHADKASAMSKDQQDPRKQAEREELRRRLEELQKLREYVVERGAKTFKELHPNAKKPDSPHRGLGYHPSGNADSEFHLNITFQVPELNDELRGAYTKLFEAVWTGNESDVKTLTLKPRGDRLPLKVAVQDKLGFSPFSIALARGHRVLAKILLEIAAAQYEPNQNEEPRRRYVIADEEDDISSVGDGSDDDVQISSELVDDVFTIENVAQLYSVGSKVQLAEFLRWRAPWWMLFPNTTGIDDWRSNTVQQFTWQPQPAFLNAWHQAIGPKSSLFDACVTIGDIDSIKMMLGALKRSPQATEGSTINKDPQGVFICTFDHLRTALQYGHMQLGEELIRLTGAGLPLDDLVRESGIKETEKPKYYQGLLIHGQHRKEWAQEGGLRYGYHGMSYSSGVRPLLLELSHMGHLLPVEWALSDTPRRLYHEFGENNRNDKRVALLSKASGGFSTVIDQWLDTRRSLAIHCAILASNRTRDEKLKIIKYLAKVIPESLETKSASGHTPLSLAYSRFDFGIAKILIDAGADQTVRDKEGRNLLHLALVSKDGWISHDLKSVKAAFDLLDRRLISEMLMDRCSEGPSGLTPLARWIWRMTDAWGNLVRRHRDDPVAVYKLISEYLSGEELKMMDGSGQFVMHHCVRATTKHNVGILRVMFEQDPQLAFMENSIGLTPIGFAETLYVRARTDKTPTMPYNGGSGYTTVLGSSGQLERVEGEKPLSAQVWELCQAVAEKHRDTKRTLVSVLQASEVSKRLASITQKRQQEQSEPWGRRYGYNKHLQFQDEVDKWA